ncbi:adenine phosphoribosyltransferase [Colletotrichum orchidophilum]|uniref:Adenine phosphoribosyltransferase n=1 Tax=Colletotrichum orchidophilum TaxID=1209926 RepID=A0A1G4B743_9PEZI|nr:adenine phosphoribosyltransferase [Colletotrichum orchidophilum]OHE97278.1 adenine phosphoribosyltransferase [Colletotrichum orchidophilum]
MATLEHLTRVLRQQATINEPPASQLLSDAQYSAGFSFFKQSSGCTTYQDFVLPQLSELLIPILNSRLRTSVLEIGPGPESVLGYLPYDTRRKIKRYTAFEPNCLFASRLEECLTSTEKSGSPLPCLEERPDIRHRPFNLDNSPKTLGEDKFDVILFCHSMYRMHPKHSSLFAALDLLAEQPTNGLVIFFHRDGPLHLNGLVPHQTASFPNGMVRVKDTDDSLDCFASFIAGFIPEPKDILLEWRKLCRALGRRDDDGNLVFAAPDIMMAFTRHSTALPELKSQLPAVADGNMPVKNREARLHRPASVIRPTHIRHVQECVRWALEHRMALTVVGGGHSGHCLWPDVVAVDISALNQVHVISGTGKAGGGLVVAGAGCKTGDIIRETMAQGLTVPLGSRPSVGAGLWLQGGIGHLARLHGLACDAIVGAVLVSVDSGRILCIGHVPTQHQPAGAMRPENDEEEELLWAIKGAGTNFGIIFSVTFAAHPAPMFLVRNWVIPMRDGDEAQRKLAAFDRGVAAQLSRNCSADAYLYWDVGKLHLGVTVYEAWTTEKASGAPTPIPTPIPTILGPEHSYKIVDSVGLFETEMYMSGMHGGHAGGKTSSFKRCLFLKEIGTVDIANALISAIHNRPSPQSYLHLLQGGGAVSDVPEPATAFGCRDWDFACVITGVWPREQDGTDVARAVVEWVYAVAETLLPLGTGAYGADLGPDPRDTAMATKAFGPNRPRLARLKRTADPRHVLAYACPLPRETMEPRLILLVTGDSCAGKDYCAEVWADVFNKNGKTARVVSISDAMKREFAAAAGADLNRLLCEREYKEKHRPALTAFFHDRVRERPRLPTEHFLEEVYSSVGVDVLLITGMRDEAPVASLGHLVPDSKLVEVRITAGAEIRRFRRGTNDGREKCSGNHEGDGELPATSDVNGCRPSLAFHNETAGDNVAKAFAEQSLLLFIHDDLKRLAKMTRIIPDFPRPGINFRHVLDIAQTPGGLALCTSLLQSHFTGAAWSKVDAIVSCEAGGFVFASALALQVGLRLVPIREAGKLPPPTVSVAKPASHISSRVPANGVKERRVEMDRDVLSCGASVVVVDDVFASGETVCAVLRLLEQAGVSVERISVMAVAEFPVHRGRELLNTHGFGVVNVQSLLVYGGP